MPEDLCQAPQPQTSRPVPPNKRPRISLRPVQKKVIPLGLQALAQLKYMLVPLLYEIRVRNCTEWPNTWPDRFRAGEGTPSPPSGVAAMAASALSPAGSITGPGNSSILYCSASRNNRHTHARRFLKPCQLMKTGERRNFPIRCVTVALLHYASCALFLHQRNIGGRKADIQKGRQHIAAR